MNMDKRMRNALDDHITGHYGDDQFKGLGELDWRTDPIIHVNSSDAVSQHVCNSAIVGGYKEGHVWLMVMAWTGARQAWLSDERWHRVSECPYDPEELRGYSEPVAAVSTANDGDHYNRPNG